MSNEVKPIRIQDIRSARASTVDIGERERLMARIGPRVRQVVRAVVSNRRFTEDIHQSAMEEVIRSLHSFQGQGTLEAWAGQIAFRTAVRHVRRHRDWDTLHTVMDDEPDIAALSPERLTTKREVLLTLEKHLSQIPAMRRTPLLLHLVYGYTVDEVSAIVGAPVNTVKDRLKTAVRELRVILDRNLELKQAMLEVIS